MSDIVERLRRPVFDSEEWYSALGAAFKMRDAGHRDSCARDLMDSYVDEAATERTEAADEIERLRAEVGHWREANRTSLTAGDVLKDEVARLTAERDDAQHAALNFGDDLRLWSIDEIVSYLEQRAEACFNRDQCSTAPTELSYCATQKAVAELKAALAERDALLARVEAAEKDTARLDFMIERFLSDRPPWDPEWHRPLTAGFFVRARESIDREIARGA